MEYSDSHISWVLAYTSCSSIYTHLIRVTAKYHTCRDPEYKSLMPTKPLINVHVKWGFLPFYTIYLFQTNKPHKICTFHQKRKMAIKLGQSEFQNAHKIRAHAV